MFGKLLSFKDENVGGLELKNRFENWVNDTLQQCEGNTKSLVCHSIFERTIIWNNYCFPDLAIDLEETSDPNTLPVDKISINEKSNDDGKKESPDVLKKQEATTQSI